MDDIQLWQALRDIGLAAGLGAAVGLERQIAGKPAGLRTQMLVSASAALFVVLGFSAVENFREETGMVVRTDPIRILQAIVIGVSFLGAGTIMQDRSSGHVEGLTTAAAILMTASIGAAVPLGHALLAAIVTVAVVILVPTLGALEDRFESRALSPRRDDAAGPEA